MSDIANAVQILTRSLSEREDDATAHYRLAVLLLDEHGQTGEDALLPRARKHLGRAIELRPRHSRSHAALGYAHDVHGHSGKEALACFREARRLNPRDKECEVLFLALLAETGQEAEALTEIEHAAARHDVDLGAVRTELAAAGFPVDAKTLLLNGFNHARNYFRSSLGEEAERILNTLDPERARRLAAAERKRCAECQQELARTFDASRVPESLRALAPAASCYGVGDDFCRPFLLQRLPKQTRMTLIRDVDAKAPAIQQWLESFGGASMADEAAAFMYLALGVEETRDGD